MAVEDTGLGATLRVWRDRLSPEEVGLPPGWSRRAAGLRREELAGLAGVSVDYLVRLEQGRATRPSAQVVAALARALRLTREEREHLHRLAGLQSPGDGVISDHIPPGVRRLLTRLGDSPAAAFSADWQMLWWNECWAAVSGDPSGVPPEQRSLVRVVFPVAGRPGRIGSWPVRRGAPEMTERAIVADLRSASGRYPDDRRLAELIHATIEGNERFAQLWRDGVVGAHEEDRKTIEHPAVGEIDVDCDVIGAGADLKIVVLTAEPGSEAAARIELARATALAYAAS